MRTYCFTNEAGTETVEREYQMGHAPSRVRVKGVPFWRDFRAEQSAKQFGKDWHNHWSMSLGVTDPTTGIEFKKKCAAAGVAEPKFRLGDSGQVQVNSEKHAKQLRALHPLGPMVDFNGYY